MALKNWDGTLHMLDKPSWDFKGERKLENFFDHWFVRPGLTSGWSAGQGGMFAPSSHTRLEDTKSRLGRPCGEGYGMTNICLYFHAIMTMVLPLTGQVHIRESEHVRKCACLTLLLCLSKVVERHAERSHAMSIILTVSEKIRSVKTHSHIHKHVYANVRTRLKEKDIRRQRRTCTHTLSLSLSLSLSLYLSLTHTLTHTYSDESRGRSSEHAGN
jgi:hypothetical protein